MLSDAERDLLRQDEVEMLKRAEAATEGPWYVGESFKSHGNNKTLPILYRGAACNNCGKNDGEWLIAHTYQNSLPRKKHSPNTAFIAHARTDVPELLSRLAAARAGERWIPVTERLPTEHGWYLVSQDNYIATMFYGMSIGNHEGFTVMGELEDPRYWRPLPSPPAESEGK